jgi:hypothetical protein
MAWRTGKTRVVAVRVRGEAPADIELSFDPTGLAPGAVRQSTPSRFEIDRDRVMIRGAAAGEFTVEFEELPGAVPILVAIRAGGAAVSGDLPSPQAVARLR